MQSLGGQLFRSWIHFAASFTVYSTLTRYVRKVYIRIQQCRPPQRNDAHKKLRRVFQGKKKLESGHTVKLLLLHLKGNKAVESGYTGACAAVAYVGRHPFFLKIRIKPSLLHPVFPASCESAGIVAKTT